MSSKHTYTVKRCWAFGTKHIQSKISCKLNAQGVRKPQEQNLLENNNEYSGRCYGISLFYIHFHFRFTDQMMFLCHDLRAKVSSSSDKS